MSYLEGAKLEKRFPILWLFPTLSILTQTHMKCNFSSTKFTSEMKKNRVNISHDGLASLGGVYTVNNAMLESGVEDNVGVNNE
jgi:hypothetical protein